MMNFFQLLAVVFAVLGVAYAGLAIALRVLNRKHGRCGCSGGSGESCCRTPDKGQGEGGA
jgi:hypothetical protein